MAREENSIGVFQTYGPFDRSDGIGYGVRSDGRRVVVEYVFDYDELPEASETDSAVPVIPANSFITYARMYTVSDSTIGNADTVDVGLQQDDGTEIDNDGLIAAGDPSTAGTWLDGSGALVGTGIGSNDGQVVVAGTSASSNITGGRFMVVVEYIRPHTVT